MEAGNLKRKAEAPLERQWAKRPKRKIYKITPGAYLGVWRYSKVAGSVSKLYISRQGFVLSDREAVQCYKQEKHNPLASVAFPPDCLEHWVPLGIAERLQSKGVSKLFAWQVECLNRKRVLEERRSLVFCAPTSGGKSLVAELLLIRSVLVHKRRTLYVVPYISIVQEKTQYLQEWLGPILRVEGFCSDSKIYAGDKCWHPFIDIAVCTIEKACAIVNRLLEEGTPERLGCVAVDEVHMLGEGERGGLLENLLIKLGLLQCQIVAMSATLPDAERFAEWLQADFCRGTFRPVPLAHYLVQGSSVLDRDLKPVRTLSNRDTAYALVMEAVQQGSQTILFCPSKHACETLAANIAGKLPIITTPAHQAMMEEALKCDELPPVLSFSLPRGTAFHHADLTSKERLLVEKYYRAGAILVLTATSTLAAGVNLPANRVIITAPCMGNQPLTCRNYLQMSGRAGRTDSGKAGESFLLVNRSSEALGKRLFTGEAEKICSGLYGPALKRALVDGLATGHITDQDTLTHYLNRSYRALSDPANLLEEGGRLLQELQASGMLADYSCTPVLKATFASMLSPDIGAHLSLELINRGAAAFCTNRLFWIYMATPRDLRVTQLNWWAVIKALNALKKEDQEVVNFLGLNEDEMARWGALGTCKEDTQAYNRLAAALAVQRRIEGSELRQVGELLEVPAGVLQNWELQTETMCGMLVVYCQRLGLWTYAAVFDALQERLSRISSDTQLQALLTLPGIKPFRAKQLYSAGLTDPAALLALNIEQLAEVLLRCETQFQLEGSTQARVQCRELAILLQSQAADWSDTHCPPAEENNDPSEDESCKEVESLMQNLSDYVDSSLEAEEYVALLQEAACTANLN